MKVEPSSYCPCTARLNSGLSEGSPFSSGLGRSLGVEIGQAGHGDDLAGLDLHQDAGRALGGFITFMPFDSTSSIAACTVRSSDRTSGAPSLAGSRSQ